MNNLTICPQCGGPMFIGDGFCSMVCEMASREKRKLHDTRWFEVKEDGNI